ncbi:MAG TPA: hypothetical protein DCS63_01055 [Elusimicrobia bacterium]|nr:hypothetical protein [Elusimicrobiota bacterium]
MNPIKNLLQNLSAALLTLAVLSANVFAVGFDSGASALSDSVATLKAESKNLRAPAVSTPSHVSNELTHFWENLKEDTFDDICRGAQLKLNENATFADIIGLDGSFKRRMKKYPSEKVALIDEVGLKLSASVGNDTLHLPDLGGLGVSITGVVEGKSQVVRPLKNDSYCRELGTLVKLYQVKTVIPAKAKRIVAMENGEIWKLPLVLRLGFGAGIGNVGETFSVSISAGATRERKPSVTLYRMDDNTLRLRLRLDRVEVRSVGVSASVIEVPFADVGLIGAENIISKQIDRRWAKEINKYLSFNISYGHSRNIGKKLLVEFMLNPNNPEQMESLEKFMRGDFGILKRFIEMGISFNNFSEDDAASNGVAEIAGVASQTGEALNADSSFAGSNVYHGHTDNLHLQVPIIHMHDYSWSTTYNRYQSLANNGETLHVQQASRVSNGSSINIPFIGKVIKHDAQQNVHVINKEGKNGQTTRPVMMYQQNEGFVRQGDISGRDMVERANGVLRYIGTNGNGTQGENVLPAAAMFPPPPEDPNAEPYANNNKTYKSAVMSFKLLVNDRGVQDIIFAPAQAIMKAYMNMMREEAASVIDKVMDLFMIDKRGKVGFDSETAAQRLGVNPTMDVFGDNGSNPLEIVDTLAYAATQVIKDIASVRDSGGWKEQSEKLAAVSAGKSKSGLKYEDFLKVVVQMVNPEDVSAEVYVHTDKRIKGEADVNQTYQFFNTSGNSFDNTLSEVNQMRERFLDPSELTD